MALPTVRGEIKIRPWACETFWVYSDTVLSAVRVSIDGGTAFDADAGTDPHSVAGWGFLVAGPECLAPGAAHVLTTGTHNVRWWSVAAPETHAGEGRIEIG